MKPSTVARRFNTRTQWVRLGLYIQVAIALVSIVSNGMEWQLLQAYQNAEYSSRALAIADGQANDQRQRIVSVIHLSVYIVTGVIILSWIYLANWNAKYLGARDMKFSPAGSIGYYFVPILNVWKPYQAMKEIWKTSQQPYEWRSQTVGSLLPLWWFLWLLSTTLSQASSRFSRYADSLQDLALLNWLSQASDVSAIVLIIVFLKMANSINSLQSQQLQVVKE